MQPVKIQALSAEAFAPFGEVIEALGTATAANQDRAQRFDAPLNMASVDARTTRLHTAIYRIKQSALPFQLTLMERHPLSPQLFFPNSGKRFLVCACPQLADGTPDLAQLRAFAGQHTQGIVWRTNVWHSPFAALDEDGDFLMQQWKCDGALDCEELPLAEPVSIE